MREPLVSLLERPSFLRCLLACEGLGSPMGSWPRVYPATGAAVAWGEESVLVGGWWLRGTWPGLSVGNAVQNPQRGRPDTESPWDTYPP